jgi:hypothetical protein
VDGPVVDRLAYVMFWTGFSCSPIGSPPAPPGSTPAPIPTYKNCAAFTVVDATTGQGLGTVEGG